MLRSGNGNARPVLDEIVREIYKGQVASFTERRDTVTKDDRITEDAARNTITRVRLPDQMTLAILHLHQVRHKPLCCQPDRRAAEVHPGQHFYQVDVADRARAGS